VEIREALKGKDDTAPLTIASQCCRHGKPCPRFQAQSPTPTASEAQRPRCWPLHCTLQLQAACRCSSTVRSSRCWSAAGMAAGGGSAPYGCASSFSLSEWPCRPSYWRASCRRFCHSRSMAESPSPCCQQTEHGGRLCGRAIVRACSAATQLPPQYEFVNDIQKFEHSVAGDMQVKRSQSPR